MLLFFTDIHLRISGKGFINGDMPLLLNNAIVWETPSVLQMEYRSKLLLFLQWKHIRALVIEIRTEFKNLSAH